MTRQTMARRRGSSADLARERERTGIKTLKVITTRSSATIEVSKANTKAARRLPAAADASGGDVTTASPGLRVPHPARTRAPQELEETLSRQVCAQVAAAARAWRRRRRWRWWTSSAAGRGGGAPPCAPHVDESDVIVIWDGRHVVERSLSDGFVPNDTYLAASDAQIAILTGPNMAGKSTYLRQVALIVLLAQVGSFVPAAEARIGLVDRIFSRVGATDDIAAGQSTFMVEMLETAAILHSATGRSLLLFDEIGRGTSTYDGMAIARAVVEFLHSRAELAARTLFATHYHELVELESLLPRVRNYNVAVSKQAGEVVFLHRILPGGADRSYGVQVAQLAGLPNRCCGRGAAGGLEAARRDPSKPARARREESPQLPLFAANSALLRELAETDVDSLTPLQALTETSTDDNLALTTATGGTLTLTVA
jgi:DNA mismatch repair protein MutS